MFKAGITAVDCQFWRCQFEAIQNFAISVLSIKADLTLVDILAGIIFTPIGEVTVQYEIFINGQILKRSDNPAAIFRNCFFKGCRCVNDSRFRS